MFGSHFGVYVGLFLASLAAATVFPFQSEVAMIGLLLEQHYPWWALVIAASIGNVLGSVVNWWLGRSINRFRGRRWFPMSEEKVTRMENHYRRFGRWSLLMSWAPIIGDPLTIVAGVLREPLPIFLLLVAIAKTGRYLAVVALTSGWL